MDQIVQNALIIRGEDLQKLRSAASILVALIANYPKILHQHLDDTFIPIVTVPDNPPFDVRMAPERRSDEAIKLIVTGGVSTPTHSFFASSWEEAATQLQQWAGEPYIIKSVGPHPTLTRMVIIR